MESAAAEEREEASEHQESPAQVTTLHPASPLLPLRARACACVRVHVQVALRVFVEPPRQTGNPKTVQTLKDHAALQGLSRPLR